MRFTGHMSKEEKWWAVEVPLLGIYTQGRTRKEALEMVVDAIEALSAETPFPVEVHLQKGRRLESGRFEVGSSEPAALFAFFLRRYRQAQGLSLADVQARLNTASRNSYARYEQGKAVPSIAKAAELVRALSSDREMVLSLSA